MDAAGKLRMVLDYVPCEACLAQPTENAREQELLCSICARVHREVAVRVAVRTTVLVERPELPPTPVVIPPAAPAEPAASPPSPSPSVEELPVELEPYEGPAEPVAVVSQAEPPEPEPAPAAKKRGFFRRREPEPASVEATAEPEFDDVAEYTAPVEDLYGVARGEPMRAEEPPVERAPAPEPPRDDFVFMPPEPAPEPAPRAEIEDVPPTEEVPVEPETPRENPWAPPEEIFADEPSQPVSLAQESVVERVEEVAPYAPPVEAEVIPAEIVEEDEHAPQNPVEGPAPPPAEEEILETTLVAEEPEVVESEVIPQEEEVVETTLVEDAPEEARSDLWRLRGFDAEAEKRLAQRRIESISHLSGHDAGELADRTGLPDATVRAWVQAADLVQEAGIPVDAAVALVAAGVEGPRGLRETEADDILDRVAAFGGGYAIQASDLKRWKRRV